MLARGLAIAVAAAVMAAPVVAQEPNRLAFDQPFAGVMAASDRLLPDGTFYQEWTFTATAGTRVTITMRSARFDSFLDLGRYPAPNRWESLQTNDDGGGGRDAQLTYTIPATGDYYVRGNTFNSNVTGPFTVLLTQAPR